MRILIVLKTRSSGAIIGMSRSLKDEFEKLGHEVKILARNEDLNLSFFKSLIFMRFMIKDIVISEGYDVVYTQDWSIAFPLIFPYNTFRNKHYCCFHGIQNRFGFLQRFVASKLGKNLIVVGDTLKSRFKYAHLVYNGVNLEKFKPNGQIKKVRNSVGFANFKREEYNFSVVGDTVHALGKKLILAENIDIDNMPLFYNKLEMFVSLPPSYTGFGLVWLEAMASGVPKIIGNNFGIGSKLPITKIEDYPTLADAMKNAREKDYRSLLNSLEINFGWKRVAEQLCNIFFVS